MSRSKRLFSAEFFSAREATADPGSPVPIFIVGLPRAGSTLVEQILASHPRWRERSSCRTFLSSCASWRTREEGTKDASSRRLPRSTRELRELGERYLASTRVHRKTGAPFFIDKMPNNCLYVGLIQLILPNAKIIDARRHPLGCCFSAFKQHFARGQNFTYDLRTWAATMPTTWS